MLKYQYVKLSIVLVTCLVWGRLAMGAFSNWSEVPFIQTTTELSQPKS